MPDYEVTLKRNTKNGFHSGMHLEDFDQHDNRYDYTKNYNKGSYIPYIININNKCRYQVSFGFLDEQQKFIQKGFLSPGEARAEKTYSSITWAVYRGNEQLYIYDAPRNLEPNTTIHLNVQTDNELSMGNNIHGGLHNNHMHGTQHDYMKGSMHDRLYDNHMRDSVHERE